MKPPRHSRDEVSAERVGFYRRTCSEEDGDSEIDLEVIQEWTLNNPQRLFREKTNDKWRLFFHQSKRTLFRQEESALPSMKFTGCTPVQSIFYLVKCLVEKIQVGRVTIAKTKRTFWGCLEKPHFRRDEKVGEGNCTDHGQYEGKWINA